MSQFIAVLALQSTSQTTGGLLSFLPFIGIFLVMYFVLIRPQMKERKRVEEETRTFRASLKNGDKIVTSGGVLGVITSVREDIVQVRIADGVKVEFLRSAIASRQAEPGVSTESKTA